MMSNKGHVRVAGYLFKFLAHLRIIPTLIHITPMGVDRHLIEMDAVAVSYPNRTWLVPATMLLPKSVPKNVHFKIGVQGSLENGKVRRVYIYEVVQACWRFGHDKDFNLSVRYGGWSAL